MNWWIKSKKHEKVSLSYIEHFLKEYQAKKQKHKLKYML